ncbi:MAG: DUF4292 domain-containing protein [Deltaproteobacteria bacterium]|nr:MAG: DUF4292 domain-containing protein [Deltaproteobacteria bacterium]
MSRAAVRCVAALAILVATGCRTLAPPAAPAVALRPEALFDALMQQSEARRSLRGLARVAVDGPAGSGRGKQVLVAARPGRLRVEFLGFLNQTVALFATDGSRYDLFQAEERFHRSGPVHAGLLFESVQVDLSPEEAVSVLLGDPGPLLGLALAPAPRAADPEVGIELVDAGGAIRRVLRFDAAARLRRAEARTASGATAWIVQFEDYRDVGDVAFAHTIELEVPASATRARLGFREVELNPDLPPDIFELRLPAGVSSELGGTGS